MLKSISRFLSVLLFMTALISCNGVMDWKAVSYFISCLSGGKCQSIEDLMSKNGLPQPDLYYKMDAFVDDYIPEYSKTGTSVHDAYVESAASSYAYIDSDDVDNPLPLGNSLRLKTWGNPTDPSKLVAPLGIPIIASGEDPGLTISFWFKTKNYPPPTGYNFMFLNASSGSISGPCSAANNIGTSGNIVSPTNYEGWSVGLNQETIFLTIEPGCEGSGIIAKKYTFSPGDWYHVFFRYSNTSKSGNVYINGQDITLSSGFGTASLGSVSLAFGDYKNPASTSDYQFDGWLDDVAIWGYVLDKKDVNAILGVD